MLKDSLDGVLLLKGKWAKKTSLLDKFARLGDVPKGIKF